MITLKRAACAAALSMAAAADATPASPLPLDPGVYVVTDYTPCNEAPLAGIKQYDGRSFVGSHESKCTTTVSSRHGSTYVVTTACVAYGDGTPQAPAPWTQTIRVRSRTAFTAIEEGEQVDYLCCPGFK